jgi:hypothetical protein
MFRLCRKFHTIARASWITTKSDRYSFTVSYSQGTVKVLMPAQSWWGNQLCFFQPTCLQLGEDRLGEGSSGASSFPVHPRYQMPCQSPSHTLVRLHKTSRIRCRSQMPVDSPQINIVELRVRGLDQGIYATRLSGEWFWPSYLRCEAPSHVQVSDTRPRSAKELQMPTHQRVVPRPLTSNAHHLLDDWYSSSFSCAIS